MTWDRLWPVLLTAVLTLLATFLIQTYVIPRTARRQRREDRREVDIRRLGELMSFDYAEASGNFGHTVWWLCYVALLRVEDPESVAEETVRDAEREMRDRRQEFDAVQSRAGWLRWAITHGQPASKIEPFETSYQRLMALYLEMQMRSYQATENDLKTPGKQLASDATAEVEAQRENARKALADVVKEIKALEESA